MDKKAKHLEYLFDFSNVKNPNFLIFKGNKMIVLRNREILFGKSCLTNQIIEKLRKYFQNNFYIRKILLGKPTLRGLINLEINYLNEKYYVNVATNGYEKYYLKRIVKYSQKFRMDNIKVVKPIYFNVQDSILIYKKINDLNELKSKKIVKEALDNFYNKLKVNVELSNEIIDKILGEMLNGWPKEFSNFIVKLEEYKKLEKFYFDNLGKVIDVSLEHGDFTKNNFLFKENELFLLDFEFVKEYQPLWFDYLDYLESIGEKEIYEIEEFYIKTAKLKLKLYNKINELLDKGEEIGN